jgi:hypothetical protein
MKSWPSRSPRRPWFPPPFDELGAILCLVATVMLGAAPAPPDAPAMAADAVRTLVAEQHGIVGFKQVYTYQERGPGHNTTRETDELDLESDGRLVGIEILRQESNGNVASPDDVAKEQARVNAQLPADDYILPLAAANLADYRFAPATCTQCPAGAAAVAFTSLKRDDDHGDGIMVTDLASHHIMQLEFAPSVLPAHVDSAAIVMHFDRVLPDLWDLVDTKQRYDGHLLFIHGWAEVRRSYSDYRRFTTLEEGLRELRAAPSQNMRQVRRAGT